MRHGEADSVSLARQALAHADALYNFARHLTGNDPDAEDLVQETYTRALGAAERFVPSPNLRAWLFRILRNTFIDVYRRRRRDPVRAGEDADAIAIAPHDDFDVDQLRAVVASEIAGALQTLSDDGRTVILLELEGLTHVEIAEVMGTPVGTVKSRLTRARLALRWRLRDYARKP